MNKGVGEMVVDGDGKLWLMIPEDNVPLNKNKLLKIINKYIKLGVENKLENFWEDYIGDEADELFSTIRELAQEKYKTENLAFSSDGEPRTDIRVIHWSVLNYLSMSFHNNLMEADLPKLKKFLLTPVGKELEGWREWEEYLKQKNTKIKK